MNIFIQAQFGNREVSVYWRYIDRILFIDS